MANESGFVDFNAFRDLNSEAEQQRLNEAMAAAEAADTTARQKLVHSSIDTQEHGDQTQGDITKAASYSDYLAAKEGAARQWAAIQSNLGSDPRMAGLHQVLNQTNHVDQAARDAGAETDRRQVNFSNDRATGYAQGKVQMDAYRAWVQKQKDDAAARGEADKKSKSDFEHSLRDKAARYWAAQDKDRKLDWNPFRTHGSNNLYTDDVGPGTSPHDTTSDQYYLGGWGTQSDAQFLTQQMNANGLNKEADKFNAPATYEGGKRTKGGW